MTAVARVGAFDRRIMNVCADILTSPELLQSEHKHERHL